MENQEQVQEQMPMMKPNSNMALAIFTTIMWVIYIVAFGGMAAIGGLASFH